MEFYIGAEFSREFSFEESRITHELAEKLNSFFKEKNYGNRVTKVNIMAICVSKGFEPFCVVRPPKVLKKEPTFVYELKLDFDEMFNADEQQRKKILVLSILETSKEILTQKTIKGFEKEKFLEDLESYFKEQGYLD